MGGRLNCRKSNSGDLDIKKMMKRNGERKAYRLHTDKRDNPDIPTKSSVVLDVFHRIDNLVY